MPWWQRAPSLVPRVRVLGCDTGSALWGELFLAEHGCWQPPPPTPCVFVPCVCHDVQCTGMHGLCIHGSMEGGEEPGKGSDSTRTAARGSEGTCEERRDSRLHFDTFRGSSITNHTSRFPNPSNQLPQAIKWTCWPELRALSPPQAS
jgi:hypothetical protein